MNSSDLSVFIIDQDIIRSAIIEDGGFPDPLSIHNLEATYIKYPEDEGFTQIDASYGPNAWQIDHCRMVLGALVDKEKLVESLKMLPAKRNKH